jgi:hypothetical protein
VDFRSSGPCDDIAGDGDGELSVHKNGHEESDQQSENGIIFHIFRVPMKFTIKAIL